MEKRRQILFLVDDNMTNLTMGKNMLRDTYDVFLVPSGQKLFTILEKVKPDLILLDIEMPGMNGYEACRRLRADTRYADILVIFLSAKNDSGSELEGLSLGAIDYISKPFSPPLLLKRIENHLTMSYQKQKLKTYNDLLQNMVEKRTYQVEELQSAILSTMAEMLEFRDAITGGHIERTGSFLKLLVDSMLKENIYREELLPWDLEHLISSAQLHDVGKIAISDMILNKPGLLSPEEFEIMKQHASIGEEAIKGIMEKTSENDFLFHARFFAASHHERWDGSGYPRGLKGKAIPLQGRIMAIADVYDALISRRPYKRPLSPAESKKIILEGRGTHFDPALTDLFDKLSGEFAAVAERCNRVPAGEGI
jgi:putative two-component system response regulator